MYTENVYSGNDRVSDTRAMTLGMESRLLSDRNGAEVLRLGVAQRLLFKEQAVVLPGETPTGEKLSDTLLEARVQWDPLWAFGSTLQYNAKASESVRSTVSARYTPGPYRVLSAAYRIQRGTSEQLDLGWQWPVSALFGPTPAKTPGKALGPGQWYTVGRMNYSMRDRKMVDLVAGFEYDAGCWLGRVVLSRLQQSTTAANQSILFQLEFNGFSRLGSSSLRTLQETVPQYQYLREEVVPPSRFQRYD
jgi:LPS-assembly protein